MKMKKLIKKIQAAEHLRDMRLLELNNSTSDTYMQNMLHANYAAVCKNLVKLRKKYLVKTGEEYVFDKQKTELKS